MVNQYFTCTCIYNMYFCYQLRWQISVKVCSHIAQTCNEHIYIAYACMWYMHGYRYHVFITSFHSLFQRKWWKGHIEMCNALTKRENKRTVRTVRAQLKLVFKIYTNRQKLEKWPVTLGTESRPPIYNPKLTLIKDYLIIHVQFENTNSKTLWSRNQIHY